MTTPTHEPIHQHVPTPAERPVRQRLARLLTELLAPGYISGALLIVVILHSAPSAAVALRWLVPSLLFGCLLPLAYLVYQVRRRRLSDIHIRVREQRPIPFLVGLASVLIGLTLLIVLGASRELLAVIAAMTTGLVIAMLTSLAWKLSVHTGAIAGTVGRPCAHLRSGGVGVGRAGRRRGLGSRRSGRPHPSAGHCRRSHWHDRGGHRLPLAPVGEATTAGGRAARSDAVRCGGSGGDAMLTADERSPAPRHFGRPRLLPLPPRLALDHPAASFADLLSHFRARLGRSQSDLGRHAGVNASYINRLESGVRRVPTADVARALAAGLELSPQETDRFL